jgi:hypothetical protein
MQELKEKYSWRKLQAFREKASKLDTNNQLSYHFVNVNIDDNLMENLRKLLFKVIFYA